MVGIELEATQFRMQCRVDACLERHGGDVNAATTGTGIGISFLFGQDIVAALSAAAREIERLRVVVRINGLRAGFTDAEIDVVLDASPQTPSFAESHPK